MCPMTNAIKADTELQCSSLVTDTVAMPRLRTDECQIAPDRLEVGQSARADANQFNCYMLTIHHFAEYFQATNTNEDHRRIGRPRVKKERHDGQIFPDRLRQLFRSAWDTVRAIVGTHRRSISGETVRC